MLPIVPVPQVLTLLMPLRYLPTVVIVPSFSKYLSKMIFISFEFSSSIIIVPSLSLVYPIEGTPPILFPVLAFFLLPEANLVFIDFSSAETASK